MTPQVRPQLIIDLGGRVLSALLLTADGELVPCSQEIRQVATRHVSADILFEPRVAEDRDFIWDDALEWFEKGGTRNFFQRAKRVGLRRPWDPQASADALQLASPLTVLSSPEALADRTVRAVLPRVASAMLEALLEPTFAFVDERQLAIGDVDPVVVLPAQVGRHAQVVLRNLFRRRGYRRLSIVRRELAAAVTFGDTAPCECVVFETSETDLHLHRVVVENDGNERRVRTAASATVAGLGWNYWSAQIAEALRMHPSAAFERSLTTLLTGSPDSLPVRLSRGALESALDDAWVGAHDLSQRLRQPLAAIRGQDLPAVFAGEIFGVAAVRTLVSSHCGHPAVDFELRTFATALRLDVVFTPSGTLRVNTLRGETAALLALAQLPAAGESCQFDTDFRLGGEGVAGQPILVHLLWGSDRVPEGNATLCAMPIQLRGQSELRLRLNLRRSPAGRRLHGTVEARMPRDVVIARARFTQELEVMR
jgi:hypothetical protein